MSNPFLWIAVVLFLVVIIDHRKFFFGRLRKSRYEKDHPELVHLHTDSLGNKWYEFSNPMQMSGLRGFEMEIAQKQADLNMDRPTLYGFIEKIESELDRGKFSRAAHLFGLMKERLDYLCEEKTLLVVAKVFFLLEGEDPARITEEYSRRKDEIFEKDPETRDFFLLAAFRITRSFSELSEEDILSYLASQRAKGM